MKLISSIIILFIYLLAYCCFSCALCSKNIHPFGWYELHWAHSSARAQWKICFKNCGCFSTCIDERRTNVWIISYLQRGGENRQPHIWGYIAKALVNGVLYSRFWIIYISEGKVRWKPRKIHTSVLLAFVFELEFQEQMFDGKGEMFHLDLGYVRVKTSARQLEAV